MNRSAREWDVYVKRAWDEQEVVIECCNFSRVGEVGRFGWGWWWRVPWKRIGWIEVLYR